jgi:hypothetical protein
VNVTAFLQCGAQHFVTIFEGNNQKYVVHKLLARKGRKRKIDKIRRNRIREEIRKENNK